MTPPHPSVLVVDDDDGIRATLVDLLLDEGYTVHEAPDGRPALERLRQSAEPMVVLLDVQMPGLDGIAMLETVAAYKDLASRHAYIVMTAYGSRTLPLKMANGLITLQAPILAKPFDIDAVVAAVRAAEHRLEMGG